MTNGVVEILQDTNVDEKLEVVCLLIDEVGNRVVRRTYSLEEERRGEKQRDE